MPPGRQGCLRSIQSSSRDLWVAWLRDHVPTNVLSVFWPPLAWHSPTLRGTRLEKAPPGLRQSQQARLCLSPAPTHRFPTLLHAKGRMETQGRDGLVF